MKTTRLLSASLALLLAMASCGKEHRCKCTYDDGMVSSDYELNVFVVDAGISCDDITMMGYERPNISDGEVHMERYEERTVTCREYGN